MSICQSCGGVIGRDCFNPQECMEITQDLAERGERAAMEQQSMREQIAALEQRNAELEAVARKLLADVGGCFKAWEHELRHVAGNTNVNIALMRLQEMEAALGKATP